VTRGVVPLRLCVTRRLPCSRCLPFLLASQTALAPSADPLGKPGLHHSHLPLLHGRVMASQVGRVAAPPDLRLVMPADVSAQATVQVSSVRPRNAAFPRAPRGCHEGGAVGVGNCPTGVA
jgi:hypothetical protein